MRYAVLLALLLFVPLLHASALPAPVAKVRALLQDGNVDAAVTAADAAVKSLAADADAWLWAGRAYGQKAMRANMLTMGRWAGRSRDAFEKSVALAPAGIDARLDLMSYYLMAPGIVGGSRDKAVAQAQAIGAIDASMGKLAQARLANHDKEAERAEALLGEAVALDAGNWQARTALAQIHERHEQWDAIRALWQAQLASGRRADYAHYQLGRAAAISGEQLEDGLIHLDRFLADEQRPDGLTAGAAQWRRGQILARLDRRDEAIAALEIASADASVGERAREELAKLRH